MASVLKPISRHHNLQVFYYEERTPPDVDWCRFVKVPPPGNLFDLNATSRLAMKIVGFLDDFDLLYCWSSGAYFQLLNVLIAQLAKKPIVIHLNGDGTLSRKHHLEAVECLIEDSMDYITLNNIDQIIPISSILHEAVLPRIKNKSKVTNPIPFTVDTYQFKPYPYPKGLTIGYAGRISPEKGFPFYFDVMKATPQQRYRIAGIPQMDVRYPDNCHYIGIFHLNEMQNFYGLCNVIALPSYGEGMPANILEAYACGRPVICTPESRPKELPLFGWEIPHNVELWKNRIETLDWAECQSVGIKAHDWITKEWPTWSDFAQKMSKVFLSITKN